MAVSVKIDVQGDDSAVRTIHVLSTGIANPQVANKRLSVWLLKWVNDNFKSQGGKVGGWRPFVAGGRRLPGGGIDTSAKLLQDTGELRASFKEFSSKDYAGVGAWVPYSVYHELGVPSRNLARRRMLPLSSDKDVVDGIIRIYNAYLYRLASKK